MSRWRGKTSCFFELLLSFSYAFSPLFSVLSPCLLDDLFAFNSLLSLPPLRFLLFLKPLISDDSSDYHRWRSLGSLGCAHCSREGRPRPRCRQGSTTFPIPFPFSSVPFPSIHPLVDGFVSLTSDSI